MAKKTRIWVDDDFKRQLKKKAIDDDLDLLGYTRKIARKKKNGVIDDDFFW